MTLAGSAFKLQMRSSTLKLNTQHGSSVRRHLFIKALVHQRAVLGYPDRSRMWHTN